MRLYKIKALFKLGIEDLTKNLNVFIYIIMPLAFAFLYSNMDTLQKDFTFSLCMLLNLSMVPIALMGTIIAEEKEKNTLRTLMLNNVKSSEILFAKALICMMFVILNNILMYFIIGFSMDNFIIYQLVGLFVSFAIILFGAFVGLLAKNQMSAGLLSMPFMIILMAPMFIGMTKSKMAEEISSFLPTDAMMTIFINISQNTLGISKIGVPLLVILIWLIASIILFNIVYKKVGVDN